jgi:hypothetical protein
MPDGGGKLAQAGPGRRAQAVAGVEARSNHAVATSRLLSERKKGAVEQ